MITWGVVHSITRDEMGPRRVTTIQKYSSLAPYSHFLPLSHKGIHFLSSQQIQDLFIFLATESLLTYSIRDWFIVFSSWFPEQPSRLSLLTKRELLFSYNWLMLLYHLMRKINDGWKSSSSDDVEIVVVFITYLDLRDCLYSLWCLLQLDLHHRLRNCCSLPLHDQSFWARMILCLKSLFELLLGGKFHWCFYYIEGARIYLNCTWVKVN